MITPIDVVDSAVKIGLGAAISGFATYWLAKTSHDNTVRKERAQRKRDMLEAIAQQVATYEEVLRQHWRAAINWIQFEPAAEPMSEAKHVEFASLVNECFDVRKEMTSAEAKLLLLGEIKCQALLKDYQASAVIFRTELIANREVTVDELREYEQHLKLKREAFFAELSEVYRRV